MNLKLYSDFYLQKWLLDNCRQFGPQSVTHAIIKEIVRRQIFENRDKQKQCPELRQSKS